MLTPVFLRSVRYRRPVPPFDVCKECGIACLVFILMCTRRPPKTCSVKHGEDTDSGRICCLGSELPLHANTVIDMRACDLILVVIPRIVNHDGSLHGRGV